MLIGRKSVSSEAELHSFFDGLFAGGVAGADVLAENAARAWEYDPLLACFHPSIE